MAASSSCPFQPRDELNVQIEELQEASSQPIKELKRWMLENVQALTIDAHRQDAAMPAERIQYRLRVQHKILCMIEEGVLNEQLNYTDVFVGNSNESKQTETTDVRN